MVASLNEEKTSVLEQRSGAAAPAPAPAPTFSPLYQQIRQSMLDSMQAGEWKPLEIIPSEMELARRYNVSQGTVRKAIDELAAENLLVRRQGKGTFVASHSDPRSVFRFLSIRANAGELPPLKSVPLECWRAKAGSDVARVLGIEVGASVIVVRRLLRFGTAPAVFDELYLPGELFGELTLDVLKNSSVSLYNLFESRFGVPMVRAEERLSAVSADRLSAELLQVNEGSPLLLVERVSYTYGNKPVEWRKGVCATQQFHYYNQLG